VTKYFCNIKILVYPLGEVLNTMTSKYY